ncbi:MAG: ATP-binding protein, partial [Bacteroidota bacterium]
HNQLKQGIEIEKNFKTVPEILCYPDELNQVWTNLIHNSIYAMHEKGKLEINVSKTDTALVVKIKDNGKGISKEIHDKVYDAFFTTKPTGEGSGLGLDIVKKIIEKHDGTIDFESEEGKGAEFRVVLPINSH